MNLAYTLRGGQAHTPGHEMDVENLTKASVFEAAQSKKESTLALKCLVRARLHAGVRHPRPCSMNAGKTFCSTSHSQTKGDSVEVG